MGVTTERAGEATVLTLRWTDRRNALGADEAVAVAEALEQAADAGGRAIVLTGEGAFCAGGDLRSLVELTAELSEGEIREHVYGRFQRIVRALRDAPVPTVAAVDGPAVGLGMDLALACDMRFVGPSGWMRQGWAAAGLIAGTGGIGFLETLRPGLLWRLIAEQPKLGPDECVANGLAEAGEPTALDAALARVADLSKIPSSVLRAYCSLARAKSWPSQDFFERSAALQAGFIASDAFRERAAALLGER